MKVQQKILILLLQCFQFLFENADAVSCKTTQYNLQTNKYIYFTSPNYPGLSKVRHNVIGLLEFSESASLDGRPITQYPFRSSLQKPHSFQASFSLQKSETAPSPLSRPGGTHQRQMRRVIAPKGYRIKLEFVKFYLVNSPNVCVNQKVRIEDLQSRITDGPYCGNTLPPIFRSTGQSVRVKLQSDARNVNQLYKGFQIKMIATMQPSSPRLRDKGGKWMKYGLTSSGSSIGGFSEKPSGPTDDMTENEKAEAANKLKNFDNNGGNEIGKIELSEIPDKQKKKKKKNVKPIEKKPPKTRPTTTTQKIVTSTLLSSHGHGHADNELHHGIIIAIAIAIIFAVALVFVAHDQCKKRGILCGATKKEEHTKGAESYKNFHGKAAAPAPHLATPASASLASQKRQQLGNNGSRATPSTRHHTSATNGHDRRRPNQQPDVTSPPPPPPHRHGRTPHPVSQRSGPIPIASSGSVPLTSPARRHHSQQPSSGKPRSTRHQHHSADDVMRHTRRSNPVS